MTSGVGGCNGRVLCLRAKLSGWYDKGYQSSGFHMANVTVVYSQTCGACPAAKDLWKGLRVKYSFGYREVDILSPDGQELAERHAIRATPATIVDGRLKFIGVPSRESAEKALGVRKEG